MKCIVVEDDPFWMAEICSGLAENGITVFPAATAQEASRQIRAHPDAGLILDIILPDRDGLEILREAREANPDVRVLAISGGGRLGADFYLKLATTFGAKAGLQKPFTTDQLVRGWQEAIAA